MDRCNYEEQFTRAVLIDQFRRESTMKKSMEKGGIAIEYMIIIPIAFISVIFVFFILFSTVEQAFVQSVVDDSVSSFADVWQHGGMNESWLENGAWDLSAVAGKQIYWESISSITKGGSKTVWMKEIMNRKLAMNPLLTLKSSSVEYVYGFPMSHIEVGAVMTYSLPGADIMRLVGIKNEITLTAYGTCSLSEPNSFINDVDYLIQSIQKTKSASEFSEFVNPLKNCLDKALKFFD
jgi:hypothetical protein